MTMTYSQKKIILFYITHHNQVKINDNMLSSLNNCMDPIVFCKSVKKHDKNKTGEEKI